MFGLPFKMVRETSRRMRKMKIRNRGYFNQGAVILLLAAVCVFLRACIFDNFSLKTLITVIIAVIVAAGMIVLAMKCDGDDRRGE